MEGIGAFLVNGVDVGPSLSLFPLPTPRLWLRHFLLTKPTQGFQSRDLRPGESGSDVCSAS